MVHEMEAKNSYFKRIAQQGNFINIALSVARRHQKLMCALLHDENFFEKAIVKSNGTVYRPHECNNNNFVLFKAQYQRLLSAEPSWIKQPLQSFLSANNLQETTTIRYNIPYLVVYYICIICPCSLYALMCVCSVRV